MHSALILLVVVSIFVGVWFVNTFKSDTKQALPSPTPVSTRLVYQDNELKFQFEYPDEFEVVNESEEQYSERTKTQYRKNFKYYVAYEPPKFIKSFVVKPKSLALTEDQFAKVPFYLWIFENPDKLTSEKWYEKYWYYPFFWGVYDSRKAEIKPASGEAEISFSPGKPKLILLPKDDKMFLFKIMENGGKILETFKLL